MGGIITGGENSPKKGAEFLVVGAIGSARGEFAGSGVTFECLREQAYEGRKAGHKMRSSDIPKRHVWGVN